MRSLKRFISTILSNCYIDFRESFIFSRILYRFLFEVSKIYRKLYFFTNFVSNNEIKFEKILKNTNKSKIEFINRKR